MSKATAKPSSSFLKKKKQQSGIIVGEIKVKSCAGIKLRKSSTSAKSGTFSPEFRNRTVFAAVAPETATPTPAPTPAESPAATSTSPTTPILFDLSSFDRSFDVDGAGYLLRVPDPGFIGPPPPPLSAYTDGLFQDERRGRYYKAFCRAAARWAHFLKFTPEMIAEIRKTKPNWNGIELNKFKSVKNKAGEGWAANCREEILVSGTSMNVGFQIEVNYESVKNYSEYDIFHLLTHELGHALGMPSPLVKDNTVELLPKIYNSLDIENNMKYYYRSTRFPKAYAAYRERYNGILVRDKLLAGKAYDLIPLENIYGHHWSESACIETYIPEYGPTNIVYRGIRNDIMSGSDGGGHTRYQYDRYFITKITLGQLCDLYFKVGGVPIYNYIECRPFDDGEVTSFSLTFAKDSIYFSGTFIDPPLNKGIKIEGEEEDKTRCAIRQNCSGCKPIYLDACGDCA